MSLLLDALKRAEEAKRLAAQPGSPTARETVPSAESLTLAPKEDVKSPLPDLDSHLDTVDQELRAEASANPKAAPRPSMPTAPAQLAGGAAQAAARNVFAAKPPPAPAKTRTMLVAGIAGSVAALGIVGYFGYQYMQLTGVLARPPLSAPPTAARPGAVAGPVSASPGLSAAPPTASDSVTVQAGNEVPPAAAPPLSTARTSRMKSPHPGATPREAASDRDRTAVRVSSAPKAVDSQLAAAYNALQDGQLAVAEAGYRDVLAREPSNVDALLGLAVIAARNGRVEDAQAAYLAVLEAAPRNAAAQAGLLSLSGSIPATQRESRLKQLLAAPPTDPTLTGLLHFALGNVYSEQQRWAEAQAAYFEATVADRDNPDYLYNLAVSLEHLQKPALAASQYAAAVRAARQRPFAFDLDLASARATALAR